MILRGMVIFPICISDEDFGAPATEFAVVRKRVTFAPFTSACSIDVSARTNLIRRDAATHGREDAASRVPIKRRGSPLVKCL
jgi:hypothetical protein